MSMQRMEIRISVTPEISLQGNPSPFSHSGYFRASFSPPLKGGKADPTVWIEAQKPEDLVDKVSNLLDRHSSWKPDAIVVEPSVGALYRSILESLGSPRCPVEYKVK